jgi:hypothetical protein
MSDMVTWMTLCVGDVRFEEVGGSLPWNIRADREKAEGEPE